MIDESVLAENSKNKDFILHLLTNYNQLFELLMQIDKKEEAIAFYEKAIEIYKKLDIDFSKKNETIISLAQNADDIGVRLTYDQPELAEKFLTFANSIFVPLYQQHKGEFQGVDGDYKWWRRGIECLNLLNMKVKRLFLVNTKIIM